MRSDMVNDSDPITFPFFPKKTFKTTNLFCHNAHSSQRPTIFGTIDTMQINQRLPYRRKVKNRIVDV